MAGKLNCGSLRIICVALFALLASISCGSGGSATPNPTPSPTPPPPSVSCPSVTLQESTGPTTGVAPFPPPAPLPPPNPGSTSAGSVCVSTPANNATVTSPAHIIAAASLVNPIDHMRVFVDGTAEYFTWFNTVNTQLWMPTGTHSVEVIATDKSGNDVSTTSQLNVVAPQNSTFSNLQNSSGWQPCGALYPPAIPAPDRSAHQALAMPFTP